MRASSCGGDGVQNALKVKLLPARGVLAKGLILLAEACSIDSMGRRTPVHTRT